MSFRSNPGLFLPQSPLLLVGAMVEVAPVVDIKELVGRLQGSLRKDGYPLFNEASGKETSLLFPAPGAVNVSTRDLLRWEFRDVAQRLTLVLTDRHFGLYTTDYSVFEGFLRLWLRALAHYHEAVQPSLVTSLGLRYVDVIDPIGPKSLQDYVSPAIFGMATLNMGDRSAYLSQSIIQTDPDSTMMVRFATSETGYACPPDLLPLQLKFPNDLLRQSSFGLLDLGHTARVALESLADVNDLEERYWRLHEPLDQMFRSCTTDQARNEWAQPRTPQIS